MRRIFAQSVRRWARRGRSFRKWGRSCARGEKRRKEASIFSHANATAQSLSINLATVPALLDANGVKRYLVPIGKTTLYELATSGEIVSVSIGMGRGKRCFLASSIVDWLNRRAETSKRPALADRRAAAATGSKA